MEIEVKQDKDITFKKLSIWSIAEKLKAIALVEKTNLS
jgi:hypothetical protein